MVLIPNTQDLTQSSGTINFGFLSNLYETFMDEALVGVGEDITLHLPAAIKEDTQTQSSEVNARRYNPLLGQPVRYPDRTKRAGVRVEHRDTVFKAHVKVGPADLDDDMGPGRLQANQVQTTTVAESQSFIRDAQNATIRGRRYQLEQGPRPVGFNEVKYIIAIWNEINSGKS